jgi:hypothetical protein
MPPKVEKETTYTLSWTIKNTTSDVSGAKVQAVLPPSVEWKNVVSPNGANISYNPVSHEILWNIGTISSGTGYNTGSQEVSFQVGFTPGNTQKGTEANLISEATFTGLDNFTGESIEKTIRPLTTRLLSDSKATFSEALVVP